MRYVNRLLVGLGLACLSWLGLDYMNHKSNEYKRDVQIESQARAVRSLIYLQQKQCHLLRRVARALKVDSSSYDCDKDYNLVAPVRFE